MCLEFLLLPIFTEEDLSLMQGAQAGPVGQPDCCWSELEFWTLRTNKMV